MGENIKIKPPGEWLRQAEYDLDTAESLFNSGRYIYTVFMCHLSIEKALKGIYANVNKKNPPKIHDLIYLLEKTNLETPEQREIFFGFLNDLSVPTRYPDDLQRLLREYKKEKTENILVKTKESLEWLKKELEKQLY